MVFVSPSGRWLKRILAAAPLPWRVQSHRVAIALGASEAARNQEREHDKPRDTGSQELHVFTCTGTETNAATSREESFCANELARESMRLPVETEGDLALPAPRTIAAFHRAYRSVVRAGAGAEAEPTRVRGVVRTVRQLSSKLVFVSLSEAPALEDGAAPPTERHAQASNALGVTAEQPCNVIVVAPRKSYEPASGTGATDGAPAADATTRLQAVAMLSGDAETYGGSDEARAEACRCAALLRNDDIVIVTGVAGMTKRGHFSIFAHEFRIEEARQLHAPLTDV